jgi:hypothetical protein
MYFVGCATVSVVFMCLIKRRAVHGSCHAAAHSITGYHTGPEGRGGGLDPRNLKPLPVRFPEPLVVEHVVIVAGGRGVINTTGQGSTQSSSRWADPRDLQPLSLRLPQSVERHCFEVVQVC